MGRQHFEGSLLPVLMGFSNGGTCSLTVEYVQVSERTVAIDRGFGLLAVPYLRDVGLYM